MKNDDQHDDDSGGGGGGATHPEMGRRLRRMEGRGGLEERRGRRGEEGTSITALAPNFFGDNNKLDRRPAASMHNSCVARELCSG